MGQLKYHNGTDWVPVDQTSGDYSSFIQNELLQGTVNGSNTIFTTAGDFASVSVYQNGLKMLPGSGNDYTVTGANQITFTEAPIAGTVLTADYSTSASYTVTGTNSFVTKQTVTGDVNGTNKDFVTAEGYVSGTLEVYINGLRQAITHVTETNSGAGTFTLDEAPATGSNVEVGYMMAGIPSGNADTVDSYHASQSTDANTIVVRGDGGGIPLSSSDLLYKWFNRTWHDHDSRVFGTTYTNPYDYPIDVCVSVDHANGTTGRQARAFAGGIIVGETYNISTSNIRTIIPITFTVPPGAEYLISSVGGGAISVFKWREMY